MNSLEAATRTDLSTMSTREVGKLGEDIAAEYLRREGWTVHDRNYYTRFGELDIVANEGQTLVFVEVKSRRTHSFGPGILAVTASKLLHTRRSIGLYLMDNAPPHRDVRIDAIDILLRPGKNPIIEHYRGIES